jgi:hypothetical protein
MQTPFFTPEYSVIPGFPERLADQRAYEESARTGGEYYSEASGDYSGAEVIVCPDEPGFPGGRLWSPEDPRFVSNFLATRIRNELHRAEADPARGPVVVLDIGGEFGTTALWLADLFADKIDTSALAVGVTNLAPSLEGHERFLRGEQQREKISALRAKVGDRVRFITTNALDMPDQTITLANGKEIPLRGNVILGHELHSVSFWSQTPGIDIMRVAETIDPTSGIYMAHTDAWERTYALGAVDEERIVQRQKEINIAHLELHRLGLRIASTVEVGAYTGERLAYRMFKGSQTLPIAV